MPATDPSQAVHLDWSIDRDAPARRALAAGAPA
jgi:hypothetical protein